MEIMIVSGGNFFRSRLLLAVLAAAVVDSLPRNDLIIESKNISFPVPYLEEALKRSEPLPRPKRNITISRRKKVNISRKRSMQSAKTMHRGCVVVQHEKRSLAKVPGKRFRGSRNGSRRKR